VLYHTRKGHTVGIVVTNLFIPLSESMEKLGEIDEPRSCHAGHDRSFAIIPRFCVLSYWVVLRGARERQPGQHALNLLVPVAPLVRPQPLFIRQFQSERPESVSGLHIVVVERVFQAAALV
jgi:hypothetical protein